MVWGCEGVCVLREGVYGVCVCVCVTCGACDYQGLWRI